MLKRIKRLAKSILGGMYDTYASMDRYERTAVVCVVGIFIVIGWVCYMGVCAAADMDTINISYTTPTQYHTIDSNPSCVRADDCTGVF